MRHNASCLNVEAGHPLRDSGQTQTLTKVMRSMEEKDGRCGLPRGVNTSRLNHVRFFSKWVKFKLRPKKQADMESSLHPGLWGGNVGDSRSRITSQALKPNTAGDLEPEGRSWCRTRQQEEAAGSRFHASYLQHPCQDSTKRPASKGTRVPTTSSGRG